MPSMVNCPAKPPSPDGSSCGWHHELLKDGSAAVSRSLCRQRPAPLLPAPLLLSLQQQTNEMLEHLPFEVVHNVPVNNLRPAVLATCARQPPFGMFLGEEP
jgi:hypothetical protein